jgi:hypothetical protein
MTYFTKLGRAAVAVALVTGAGAAQAAGAGLRIGTTGLGADFGWGLAPTLGARIGVSGGSLSRDVSTDDVNYDAKLKLANFNAFLDWSPLGPFRITAGLIPNNNKIDLTGEPRNGTFTINGVTYGANQLAAFNGTVKPGHSVAPYLGFGYGNVWTKGVNFYFDAGVMFMGSPKVTLNATCGPALNATDCNTLQTNVETERRKVEDKLQKFQYYPVANIGITIGF